MRPILLVDSWNRTGVQVEWLKAGCVDVIGVECRAFRLGSVAFLSLRIAESETQT